MTSAANDPRTDPDSLTAGLVCAHCGAELQGDGPDRRRCGRDGVAYERVGGIWRFLAGAEAERLRTFRQLYDRVRRAESWRCTPDVQRLRALPQVPPDDPHAAIWRVRAASSRALLRRIAAPLARRRGRPLHVADLGAGNGWLANRLAGAGHRVAAVDLDDDAADGLGAVAAYGQDAIVAVQASFERLPWAAGSFDLAVFNGSLHYSEDLARPLTEALRVLGSGGRVAILDSPFYRRAASGETMLREREHEFEARYGETSPLAHEGFLTRDRLRELGRDLGITWRIHRPWYGLAWALRPLKNRLLRLREPTRFFVVEGRRA